MKHLTLVLTVFICLNTFSQNRKKILKEIEQIKNNNYYNASYDISNENLEHLIYKYFSEYKLLNKDSNILTLYRIDDFDAKDSYEKVKHKLYLTIIIVNGLKKVTLNDEVRAYSKPFTPMPNNPVKGGYKLNRKAFYKYLYNHTKQNKISYPKKLRTKIYTYNKKQKKEDKKIIEGRDY